MINKYVAMGLGALIALAPVAALAQEQVAQAAPAATEAKPRDHSHDYGIAQTPCPPPGAHRCAPCKSFGPPHGQDDGPGRSRRGSEELIDETRAVLGARTGCEGGRVIAAPFVCIEWSELTGRRMSRHASRPGIGLSAPTFLYVAESSMGSAANRGGPALSPLE